MERQSRDEAEGKVVLICRLLIAACPSGSDDDNPRQMIPSI